MPTKYKGVHVKVVDDYNIAEIIRSPMIDLDIRASSSPDRLVKRRRKKNDENSSRKEEYSSNSSTSLLEDLPGQMPSDDCADSATESQASSSGTVKTSKMKKGRASRKSSTQQEEVVEVYISKSTPAEALLDSNTADKDLADGPLPIFAINNSVDEEDTDNRDAVMINKVLQSEFFKVNCSETHLDQGINYNSEHNGHLSEDYLSFNEPAQEGSERQDQIQEGDDDQTCVSNHSNDSTTELVWLNCEPATQSSDGLEFREVPSEQLTNIDLVEQFEGEITDVACSERAPAATSEGTDEGTLDIELVEPEAFEEKLQTLHSLPCSQTLHSLPCSQTLYSLPCSPGHVLTSQICPPGPEIADSDFKPVGVAFYDSFPLGCQEVTLACEGDVEMSSVSTECKARSVIHAKWKRNSRGRKMKSVADWERLSNETDSSVSVEPRQAKARTKRHSETGVTDEDSSVCSQDEAAGRKSRTTGTKTVDSKTPRTDDKKTPKTLDSKTPRTDDKNTPKTLDSKTPRAIDKKTSRTGDSKMQRHVDTRTPTVDTRTQKTAIIRKAMTEQTSIPKPGSSATAKKLIHDHKNRPAQADRPESSAAKTPRFVRRRLSGCGQTSKAESVSAESEFQSMSLLIEKYQQGHQRTSIAIHSKSGEPASAQNSLSKHLSSKRPEGKSALTVGKSASTVGKSASTVGKSASNVGKSASTVGKSASIVGKSASNVGKSASNVGKSASMGKHDLLEKTHSIDKLKAKSKEAYNSDPPINEESSSVNRHRGAVKRKVTTVDKSSSKADPTKVRKSEPALKIKSATGSVSDDTFHKVSSETADNLDKIVGTLGNSACLPVGVTSPPLDVLCASQSIASGSKSKSSLAYFFPPPEYISFNHSGEVEISDIIMNALPQLVENGFAQVYLFPNNATLPSSDRQEKVVFAADLNSTPFKFLPTSLPNKKPEQGTLADKVQEPQTVAEIPGSQIPLGKLQSTSSLSGKGTALSSFGDSGDTKEETPSMSVDRTSTAEKLIPDTRERLINWTCVDTSAWLEKHGLNRLIPSFSFIDGPSLLELAHFFNEDVDSATGYLHDLGFIFNDQIQLFAALKTICTQTFRQTGLSSVEVPHAGHSDLSSQATETQDMAAPTPKRRGRKPKSRRLHPKKASEGTNCPLAQGDSILRIPFSKWTAENVSSWLISHGLSRFLPEFVHFNGESLSSLVYLFNTNVRAVYKMLARMDFTLFESLKFCARLRELSQSLEETSLNSTKV